jgi:hypothetical protein
MIQLDYRNVSTDKVGYEHGLAISECFEQHRGRLQEIITQLYATKDQAGGW